MKVPFLSVGAESVGARTERCRGRSQLSGDYVVEDVQIGEQFFRQEGDILVYFPILFALKCFYAPYKMADHFKAVLGIRDILVRIRGSAPLTNGSGSNSGPDSFLQ